MHIFLKQTITKGELSKRLNVSRCKFRDMISEVPEIETSKKHILSNDDVNAFFKHYKFSPKLLEDIAEISSTNYYEYEGD